MAPGWKRSRTTSRIMSSMIWVRQLESYASGAPLGESSDMIMGRPPLGFWFFGGGTVSRWWYGGQGGIVLGVPIDKFFFLPCRYLPPFFRHRIRVVYSHIENCQTVDEIKHPAVREVM